MTNSDPLRGLVPDDPLGFTKEYLECSLDPKVLDNLLHWMWGQTMAINDKGERVIYTGDVERFFAGSPIID